MIPSVWRALEGLPIQAAEDGGLINQTYLAGDPPRWVVQRVNRAIFEPRVHEDIEAVTAHLAARGMPTPRLLRTDDGGLCHVTASGELWRAMDFVPGVTVHRASTSSLAAEAGALVARFHAALDDFAWEYRHVRPGAHDTVQHMRRLEGVLAEGPARPVAEAILGAWSSWEGRLDLPPRHIHGDLKISNLRFTPDGRGLCLLDLDTLQWGSIDVELGDAWRSWCNPVGEDSPDTRFDLGIFTAAVKGYRAARAFDPDEREALAGGVERIALELAARFCRDVWEDTYFGWDRTRFPSRAAHNLHRARGQLQLAVSARAQRSAADAVVRG